MGAILVVGLGCEGAEPTHITQEITKFGKPVSCITIQDEGGTLQCQAHGISIARQYAQDLSQQDYEEINVSELILGMGAEVPIPPLASLLTLPAALHPIY